MGDGVICLTYRKGDKPLSFPLADPGLHIYSYGHRQIIESSPALSTG